MFARSIICFLIILFAALFTAQEGHAQHPFDSWTTEDGLPQNQIGDIIQTQDGYLWMTTFNGLVRFDGVRFKVFNPGNTKELNTNRLVKFTEDPDGSLWITTESSGIIRYKDNHFKTYTTKDGLPDNFVSIRVFKQERSFYLVFYSPKGAVKFINEEFLPCSADEISPYAGYGFQTSLTTAWYPLKDGFHKIENGREVAYLPITEFNPEVLSILLEDRDGSLWFRTATGELKHYQHGIINSVYLKGTNTVTPVIMTLYQDRQGTIWGASFFGLVIFKDNTFSYLTTKEGLLDNSVRVIYQDRENNIWVGSNGGLNRLRNYFITSYSKADGMLNDNIYPICQDSKGDIWIGSTIGLTQYKDGKFIDRSELVHHLKENQLLPQGVRSIMEDREGYLWVGLATMGIIKVKDGQIVYKNRDGLFKDNGSNAIYQDHNGVIWFGTNNGLIKLKDSVFTLYTTEQGLPGNYISTIYEDRNHNLWIGTQFGLSVMHGESFRNYGKNEGLSGFLVRTIYEDSEGVFWIGTYDGGLNRIKDGHITSYTTNNGLYDNGASQIFEDKRGNFWISCNAGIYRVKKLELNEFAEGKLRSITCVAYGKGDGMLDSECNGGVQSAGIRARDGRFWIPTVKGVAVFDPDSVPISDQPPTIKMEEILVDKEPIAPGDTLTLQPSNENLEIHYTSLSFIMSNQCKFKYKMEGLDRDWVEVDTRRTAFYSHIPPGNYIFTVIGANRDGVWNSEGAHINVIVVPPYWRTWWFSALVAGMLVSMILLFYMRRVAILKEERIAQENFSRQLIDSQENERKRLAAELHDSLAQTLLVIKHRALLTIRAISKNGNVMEHLNEISATTDMAINEVSELSYNLRPHQLDRLGLPRAIEAMLERITGSSGIIFSTKIDAIEGLLTEQDEIGIYRIIQESVNNIVKHSAATEADVELQRDGQELKITIADNGKGFDYEAINDKRADGKFTKSGFGLKGIVERAKILGGRPVIASKSGTGTTITIQVSLRKIKDEGSDHHSHSRRSSSGAQRAKTGN